jgi:lysophospholipase L1-like esterase
MLYRENEANKKYIDQFNNKIHTYCKSNGISIIDLKDFLSDESGLKKDFSRDGVHLNNNAYRIWGNEINRVLHEKKYL